MTEWDTSQTDVFSNSRSESECLVSFEGLSLVPVVSFHPSVQFWYKSVFITKHSSRGVIKTRDENTEVHTARIPVILAAFSTFHERAFSCTSKTSTEAVVFSDRLKSQWENYRGEKASRTDSIIKTLSGYLIKLDYGCLRVRRARWTGITAASPPVHSAAARQTKPHKLPQPLTLTQQPAALINTAFLFLFDELKSLLFKDKNFAQKKKKFAVFRDRRQPFSDSCFGETSFRFDSFFTFIFRSDQSNMNRHSARLQLNYFPILRLLFFKNSLQSACRQIAIPAIVRGFVGFPVFSCKTFVVPTRCLANKKNRTMRQFLSATPRSPWKQTRCSFQVFLVLSWQFFLGKRKSAKQTLLLNLLKKVHKASVGWAYRAYSNTQQ